MSSPVLALDVTAAIVGNTGVARYAVNLPAAIEALGVPVTRFAVGRGPSTDPAIRHLRVPLRVMQKVWVSGHPRVERLLGRPVDLVHSLDLVPPPTTAPTLVTVHDLGGLERPDLHSELTLAAARRQLAAARSVDLVCAVSGATRSALVARGIAEERIVVTPNGLTPLPAPEGPPRVEPGYVLLVGTISPRKGYDIVVRAMAQLPGVRLVLAGPQGYRAEETMALIESSPARERILQLGFVDDATLSVLLRDAGCQVVPSRIEGFGIPLLEAMVRRLPVVCSDIPALREVGADVPTFVPVDDVDATAAAILQALTGPGPTDGPDVAALFTWERAARAALGAYEAVLGRSLLLGSV